VRHCQYRQLPHQDVAQPAAAAARAADLRLVRALRLQSLFPVCIPMLHLRRHALPAQVHRPVQSQALPSRSWLAA